MSTFRRAWRLIPLLVAVLLVAASAVGARAAYSIAHFNVAASCTVAPQLHYVFDGVDRTPPGGMLGNGNPVGFICSGHSYVPVRWLAGELGRAVGWNGKTDTISVSSSGARQNGTEFHVEQVQTGSGGTSVSVEVYNTTARTSYASFTVQFKDGFGHVLGTIQGPQSGADSFGKAEIGPGQTQTIPVSSAHDFTGYVSIAIAPWADACPVACPPLPG